MFNSLKATCAPHMGWMTYADLLKETGPSQFDVDIFESDLSSDGLKFTGGAIDFVDRLISASTPMFNILLGQMVSEGKAPIVKLSKSVFERFEFQNNLVRMATSVPSILDQYHKIGRAHV